MLRSLLRPPAVPLRARTYSVFSSSNGGRYFTPSKKVVTPAANAPSASDAKSEAADASGPSDVPQPLTPTPTLALFTSSLNAPAYPPLSAGDLRLHQFFSLHAPLQLQTPTSSLFSRAESDAAWASWTGADPAPESEAEMPFMLESPAEASPEADADAARQLARAVALHRAGAAASWNATLERLGLPTDADEAVMSAFEDAVQMDSVRRKRRKKMKKHKLKKRRRLLRMQKERMQK
ncbi:hypothetical protein PENSPDRAFT_751413 [Peniophora sp. CONT]|nr:hypothetical protein PENSPDRAFT_751413 [Peniophora sp. CONT]